MLSVIPFSAVSTLVQIKACYAGCGSAQPGCTQRSCSCRFDASVVCLTAARYEHPAQQAAVADAALRPRDRWLFEREMHTTVIPLKKGGAAKRQAVGRQSSTPVQPAPRL